MLEGRVDALSSVRRWISPRAGLKDLEPLIISLEGMSQKMDKPEGGIESAT